MRTVLGLAAFAVSAQAQDCPISEVTMFESNPDSQIAAADESGVDANGNLALRFEYPPSFDYVGISFGSCVFATNATTFPIVDAPAGGTWTIVSQANGCQLAEFSASLNVALDQCGFVRDDSDNDAQVATAQGLSVAESTSDAIRGSTYTQSSTREFEFSIKLGTALTDIQSDPVQVFGPVLSYSTVTGKSFDIDTEQLTLDFLTSVQWPYELTIQDVMATWTPPAGFTKLSGLEVTVDPCVSGQECQQLWRVVLGRVDSCVDVVSQTLDGSYSFDYTVACNADFTGQCDTPEVGSTSISFSTSSDNYCERVLEEIPLTAEFTFADGFDTFVFGTDAVFTVTVESLANLQNVHVEKVQLIHNIGTPEQTEIVIFLDPHASRADFDAVRTPTYPDATLIDSEFTLANFDDATASGQTGACDMSFLWSDATSPATGDFSTPTTISVDIRARFPNGAARRMLLQAPAGNKKASDTPATRSEGTASVFRSGASSAQASFLLATIAAGVAFILA